MGVGLVLALLLAGCHTTYRYSYEPSVQGEAKTKGRYHLRSCRVVRNGKDLHEHEMPNDGSQYLRDATVVICFGLEGEGRARVHAKLPEVFSEEGIPVDVIVYVDDDKRKSSLVDLSAFGAILSLGILPGWTHWDEEDCIKLSVDEGKGNVEGEFLMMREYRHGMSSSGLNRLFPYQHRTDVRFTCEGSSFGSQEEPMKSEAACKVDAYAYAIAAMLAQMERDGKLSGVAQRQALQEKTEPKAKEPAASGRLLELRQLWDAGVITEEEYRREVDKVNGIR